MGLGRTIGLARAGGRRQDARDGIADLVVELETREHAISPASPAA